MSEGSCSTDTGSPRPCTRWCSTMPCQPPRCTLRWRRSRWCWRCNRWPRRRMSECSCSTDMSYRPCMRSCSTTPPQPRRCTRRWRRSRWCWRCSRWPQRCKFEGSCSKDMSPQPCMRSCSTMPRQPRRCTPRWCRSSPSARTSRCLYLARRWRAPMRSRMCSRPSCKLDPCCTCNGLFRLAQYRSGVPRRRPPCPTVHCYKSARCRPNTGLRFPSKRPSFHPLPLRRP